MDLTVKPLNGECFNINVSNHASVEDLRSKVADHCHLSSGQPKLAFGDIGLKHGLLKDYGICDKSVINLVIGNVVQFRLTVKLPNGNTETVVVDLDESIVNIKKMINERYPEYIAEQQLLTFGNGRKLTDGKLSHYDVKDGQELVLKMALISVNVRPFNQSPLQMEVTAAETVDGLKNRLHEKTTVLPQQQNLFLQSRKGNKPLTSGSLGCNGVVSGSNIHVAGRTRGG